MATDVLAETERAAVRARGFTHLAGVVMAPTVSALWERRALDVLTAAPGFIPSSETVPRTHANGGSLRVALRLLASCGWLAERRGSDGTRACALTPDGRAALAVAAPLCRQVTSSFLPKALVLEDFLGRRSD